MQTQLTRSTSDRMLAGVCGGLARYFNIDATIVRLVFVVAVLSGVSPLIYIVLWIVMPEDTKVGAPTLPPPVQQSQDPSQQSQDPTGEWQYDPYTGQRIEKP
jgi:phage shock protein C